MDFKKNKFIKILAVMSIILAVASSFFNFFAIGLILPALIILLTENKKIYLIFSTILILECLTGFYLLWLVLAIGDAS